jgi:hypothetical protein
VPTGGRFWKRLALALGGAGVAVALAEGAVRLSGHDFGAAATARLPPAYRPPDVDMGGGVLRRSGPLAWRGRPLQAFVRQLGYSTALYADEAELEVHHDQDGFRNPPGLADWDVVVVGDSFVESGTLADGDTPTAVLAARRGLVVKALGVSGTGPRAHVRYLRSFGLAPRCKDAVLVFFEGNDVSDLLREELHALGHIPLPREAERRGRPHRSLVGHLRATLARTLAAPPPDPVEADVTLGSNTYAVGLGGQPPGPPSAAAAAALGATLREWSDAARAAGLRPWIAYLPVKTRVLSLAGTVRPRPGVRPLALAPDAAELPRQVLSLAAASGARTLDLLPPLLAASRTGLLLYHPVVDDHLSRDGARVVGEALADALR